MQKIDRIYGVQHISGIFLCKNGASFFRRMLRLFFYDLFSSTQAYTHASCFSLFRTIGAEQLYIIIGTNA